MKPTSLPTGQTRDLLMLLLHERTGTELQAAFKKHHGREISIGSLYTTLRRLRHAGLIEITRADADEDGRYRHYRISASGRDCIAYEAMQAREHARETLAALRGLGR